MPPAISKVCATGTIPELLTVPLVGFKEYKAACEAGEIIEPSVSEPTASTPNPDGTATAEPVDDPLGDMIR